MTGKMPVSTGNPLSVELDVLPHSDRIIDTNPQITQITQMKRN